MAEKKETKKTRKKSKKETKAEKKEEEKEEIKEKLVEEMNEKIEKEEEKEEEKEHPDKKQLHSESKTLAIFLGVLILIALSFAAYLIFSNNVSSFTSGGMNYTIVHEGKLTFYNTHVPIVMNGTKYNFQIYLYNDPRTLQKTVPFNGTLYIRSNLVLNYTNNIDCNGDGVIAMANVFNVYHYLGINAVLDSNYTCDPQARYVYATIKLSNQTDIQENSPGCYTINVANCQILPATERFITETLSTLHNYSYF